MKWKSEAFETGVKHLKLHDQFWYLKKKFSEWNLGLTLKRLLQFELYRYFILFWKSLLLGVFCEFVDLHNSCVPCIKWENRSYLWFRKMWKVHIAPIRQLEIELSVLFNHSMCLWSDENDTINSCLQSFIGTHPWLSDKGWVYKRLVLASMNFLRGGENCISRREENLTNMICYFLKNFIYLY